ncbi:MAG TPA: hypothetical protein VHE37_08005 [Nevskiaceae bacterium]|nr:hypothetical protein [Nevskiaceae bacterium]
MSMQTRHFVLADDGIREFSAEQAATIAAGGGRLPEFAGRNVRYLQLTVNDEISDGEIKVQTSGASIRFDNDGRISGAEPPGEAQQISRFEHDAVVQWALKNLPAVAPTFH